MSSYGGLSKSTSIHVTQTTSSRNVSSSTSDLVFLCTLNSKARHWPLSHACSIALVVDYIAALELDQGVLNPSKYYFLGERKLASHSSLDLCRSHCTSYLFSEIVQVVCGATNASAMGLLQLEPLHTISCESID